MKFLLYLYYFLRSALSRGLWNTLRLLKAELRYEIYFGIQSSTIKKSDSREFFHYQGASYLVLQRIFKKLMAYTGNIRFTDIGCGKGRVLCVAEHEGYSNLVGIELDDSLLQVAKENIARYPFKKPGSNFTLVHANATMYAYTNQPAVYFLFNPFHETVLREVLHKIRNSSRAETWFVYMNPLYCAPFAEQQSETVETIKTRWYTEAIIYKWPALSSDKG